MLIFQYMSSRHGASPLSAHVFKLTSLVLVELELIRIRSETHIFLGILLAVVLA
jgi:hypothetical protein